MKDKSTSDKLDATAGGIWVNIDDIYGELKLDFKNDPSFFDLKDESFKVFKDVIINCTMEKCDDNIYLNGRVSAPLEFICSRCLCSFMAQIDTGFSVEYLPEGEESYKEEVELVEGDFNICYYKGDKIDILPPIRDQFLLSIPIKPVCKENCRGLCPHCGQDLNVGKCNCQAEDIDDRLVVLKKIKL